MTHGEIDYIQQHHAPLQALYKLWTRKEAAIKCLGIGMELSRLSSMPVLRDSINCDGKPLLLSTCKVYENYTVSCAVSAMP